MSNFGQAALTIGGAALGFVLPGVGWAIGATLGSMAGSALFPTDLGTVSGPRLNDLNVQSSAVGAPIPIVYGTYAIAGNVIWSSGLIEKVSRKRQGGKGGPSQTLKTFSYSVNCAVGICEGEIGGIVRIWADAKLIYDDRPQLDGESDEDYAARQAANDALDIEIYLGDAAQLADPTIESFEGAGNVSAFRDLAYVVFTEFQLEEYGNRVPNFRFEVTNDGLVCTSETQFSNEVLFPWLESAADPRNPKNLHSYRPQNGGVGPYYYDFQDAIDAGSALFGVTLDPTIYGWHPTSGNHTARPTAPYEVLDAAENVEVYLAVNLFAGGEPVLNEFPATLCAVSVPSEDFSWWHGGLSGGTWGDHGVYYRDSDHSGKPGGTQVNSTSYDCGGGGRLWVWWDRHIECRREPQAPYDECVVPGETPRPGLEGYPGYCVLEDGTIQEIKSWSVVTGANIAHVLQTHTELGFPDPQVSKYPLSPARPVGHPEDTQAFWEAAYAEAVTAGDMAGGLTYGIDYPVLQSFYYARTVEICSISPGQITLGAIVRDVCERCGLAPEQIDVSDLDELVDGYVVTRVMSGRDAISPLRSYGWFDCVESDGVLKWPTRGKPGVFTFTDDDLAAHIAGDSRPSSVETDRQQEVELPRRLRVHYAQTEQNYEPGEQGASRLAAGDVEVRDMEIAVAMSDTKGARIADVVLYDLWWSRNRYRAIVDHSWLHLEPADAGTMPIDGRQERVRIVNIDHSLPGLLRVDLVRDDDGVYESYALGAPAAYAGTGGGSLAIVGTAELVLLDLPLLRDSDNDAGYYAAVAAIGSTTFGGAVLYRSPDGGTTYEEVATTAEQATLGVLQAALDPGPTTIIDEGNELFVELDAGDLESISEASLLAGLNAAAIGDDGRWEIIQFRDAVSSGSPTAWRLTGLLRGRRGTEWAIGTSQAGDRFVLLDSALMRVPMNIAAIGASRPHKGVLVGTSLEATTAIDFTGRGVALEPFAPVSIEGEWDSGDLVITWLRRGRVGQELPGGADIPLSEETEAYEVDIVVPGSPDVVRTLTSATQSVTYTAAQLAADFGSPTPTSIDVRIYQLSAVVGRGYAAEATL